MTNKWLWILVGLSLQPGATRAMNCTDPDRVCTFEDSGQSDTCYVFYSSCVADGCHIATCGFTVEPSDNCYVW
jgi:hypothetical protein